MLDRNQEDILCELVNMGVGDAASILNQMVNSHIQLTTPYIKALNIQQFPEELASDIGVDVSVIQMKFEGEMVGSADLLFPTESVNNLVSLLTDEDEEEDLDSLRASTVTEVGNIILNSIMASFSNASSGKLKYHVPTFQELKTQTYSKGFESLDDLMAVLCHVNFKAKEMNLEGKVILIFHLQSLINLITKIDSD